MTVSAPSADHPFNATLADTASPWGNPSQRAAQRRNKYQALLATAAHLFKQQGFACTSLDQVAAQLGITKPTLYYYVRSKAELVHACAMAGLERAQTSVERALADAAATDGLVNGLKAYASAVATDFGWCMVRVTEYAQPALLNRQLAQQRKALEQCLGAASTCAMPVTVMLRALEGVVLHVPRSHWAGVIDQLTAPVVAVPPPASPAPEALAEGPVMQSPAKVNMPVVLQPAEAAGDGLFPTPEVAIDPANHETVNMPGNEKHKEKQSIVPMPPVEKKATKRSVDSASQPPPAIEQISLF